MWPGDNTHCGVIYTSSSPLHYCNTPPPHSLASLLLTVRWSFPSLNFLFHPPIFAIITIVITMNILLVVFAMSKLCLFKIIRIIWWSQSPWSDKLWHHLIKTLLYASQSYCHLWSLLPPLIFITIQIPADLFFHVNQMIIMTMKIFTDHDKCAPSDSKNPLLMLRNMILLLEQQKQERRKGQLEFKSVKDRLLQWNLWKYVITMWLLSDSMMWTLCIELHPLSLAAV